MEFIIEGRSCFIDEQDAILCLCKKWRIQKPRRPGATEYVVAWDWINGKTKAVYLHRLVTAADQDTFVDHVDGNGLNNSRENLRKCNRSQNSFNRGAPNRRRDDGDRIKGVTRTKHGSWRGSVVAYGTYHRKFFSSKEEAIDWVAKTREEAHGEFSRG